MGLNIKNERVCALAREAAAETGRTQTGVIELALERLLAEHRSGAIREMRLEQARRTLAEMQRGWVGTEPERPFTTDDLYDENGLPA